jgi:tRNA pseudouridine55 synthase
MQKEQIANLTGFLLINKPKHISSFDCIRHIKKILKQKIKIGHTGTLDNFATGLLILCLGRNATKLVPKLLNFDKEYLVKAKLGELTNTLDHTGILIENQDISTLNISKKDLQTAIESVGTEYLQTPPIYSALKFQGTSLYKLARNNIMNQQQLEEIIKQKARIVKIHKIELLDFDSPFFTFQASVSKGTYVRSLANDIAQILKLSATTYELERTKIGNFFLKDATDLYSIKTLSDITNNLISLEKI